MKRTTGFAAGDAAPAKARATPHSAIGLISSLIGSDRLLDLILKHTGDLIVILDRNGKRIYNSPSYRDVLGDPEALQGTNAFAQIHPEDRNQIQKLFQQTVRTGKGKRAEFRFLLPDGTVKHIESRGHIIRDVRREIRYVVVISRDITSHQHTRMKLAETEATFRGLVENSFVGVYVIQDGGFKYVNPRICEIMGYDAQELTGGMTVTDTVVPEERVRVEEYILCHLAEETPPLWYVYRALRKDGAQIDLELAGTRTVYNGRPAIIGTLVDITERKQTEAALREGEERYRAIIAGMGDGIMLHDARGALSSWNPSAMRLLGLSAADLEGWPYLKKEVDPIHEDGSAVLPGEYPAMVSLHTGTPCTDTVLGFRTPSGNRRWISINTQPLVREGDELPYAVVTSFTDITRRKEAENALHRSEQRFRSLVEAIPDWIWETDAAGRYTYASPKVKDLLGFEPTEVLGKRPRDFMQSPDAKEFGLQIMGFASRREPFSGLQNRHLTKDGRTVVLETSGVPVFDDKGHFRGYRGIDRDVTSRKHGEEERARLKMAVDQAAESILITEPDGRIVYVNPAFERITGYGRNEVLGKTPRILTSGKHDAAYFAALWGTITHGEVWYGQITNRRKDGSLYDEEVVISPVRDSPGSIVNYVAVQRDMTHELEMERHLRQSQKMESLGQLAGGIAHDFNNVLGVIQGGLALLKSRVTDESHMRYIEISESAVNRGADVAKRLLMFSRDGQIQLRPLAFADVADELIRVLEHSIEKTVEIVTDIPPDLPIIQGDAGELYQMLLNLCINARDAILQPEGRRLTGRITIAATTLSGAAVRKNFKDAIAPTYLRVSVSDTGSGMTDEVKSRIFEPFFTTKPPGKGTGLGLAVVYGIVKNHHGIIDLESSPGAGTTFHIYLVACPEERLVAPEKRNEEIVGGTETILVVEDEEALRNLLTELLESYGYTVLKAEDGVSGLEQFTHHRDEIEAVITDMGLPRMSGQDLFTRIREMDPSSRVVLASGYLDTELKSHLIALGAKAFLQKPYQPNDILRVIRGVIDVGRQTKREVP
jgi:PAS domain S-box-containing protein